MQALIAVGEIAAPAPYFVGLDDSASRDLHACPNGETIALGACQFEADPVSAGNRLLICTGSSRVIRSGSGESR